MTQIIKQAKNYLSKGDYEKTFETLMSLFQSEGKYENLESLLVQLQTQYAKVKEDEGLGVISIDDARIGYNRITKGLLQLMEKAEKDDLSANMDSTDAATSKSYSFWPIITILVLGFVGMLVYNKVLHRRTPPTKTDEICPKYAGSSAFNVLVLPFLSYGEQKAKIHRAIQNRLTRFSEQNHLGVDVELSGIKPEDEKKYPKGNNDATRLAKHCNAELIIWGTYENEPGNKDKLVMTNFQFVDVPKSQDYPADLADGGNQIDTIASISSIATNGTITGKIEGYIERILLGVIANRMGKPDIAVKALEGVQPNAEDIALVGTVMADSYLKTGKTDKAIAAYSKVLKVKPHDLIALNNRAYLYREKKNYKAALKDVQTKVRVNPKDENARLMLPYLLMQTGELDKAEAEIKKIERTKIEPKKVEKLKEYYQLKKQNPNYKLVIPNISTAKIKKTNK